MAAKDLRGVAKARVQYDQARARLEEKIVRAYEAGETMRDIADRAGLRHQRISEIIRRHERDRGL